MDSTNIESIKQFALKKVINLPLKEFLKDNIIIFLKNILINSNMINNLILELINIKNISILSKIFEILYEILSDNLEENYNIPKTVFNLINIHFPQNFTKVDSISFNFLLNSSKLCSLFPNEIFSLFNPLPSNPNLISFYLLLFYFIPNSDIKLVYSFISIKLTYSNLSFSTLILMSKFNDIPNSPPFKSIINSLKSISDSDLFLILFPFILQSIEIRFNNSNIKELPTLISYLSKRLKKDNKFSIIFGNFLEKLFSLNDSINIFKKNNY